MSDNILESDEIDPTAKPRREKYVPKFGKDYWFRNYIRLEPDEELRLLKQFSINKDKETANKLVEHYTPLTLSIANRFYSPESSKVSYDYIVLAGLSGLFFAIRRYDVNRHSERISFFKKYIEAQIIKELYGSTLVSVSDYLRQKVNKIRKQIELLKSSLYTTDEEYFLSLNETYRIVKKIHEHTKFEFVRLAIGRMIDNLELLMDHSDREDHANSDIIERIIKELNSLTFFTITYIDDPVDRFKMPLNGEIDDDGISTIGDGISTIGETIEGPASKGLESIPENTDQKRKLLRRVILKELSTIEKQELRQSYLLYCFWKQVREHLTKAGFEIPDSLLPDVEKLDIPDDYFTQDQLLEEQVGKILGVSDSMISQRVKGVNDSLRENPIIIELREDIAESERGL